MDEKNTPEFGKFLVTAMKQTKIFPSSKFIETDTKNFSNFSVVISYMIMKRHIEVQKARESTLNLHWSPRISTFDPHFHFRFYGGDKRWTIFRYVQGPSNYPKSHSGDGGFEDSKKPFNRPVKLATASAFSPASNVNASRLIETRWASSSLPNRSVIETKRVCVDLQGTEKCLGC